MSDTRVTDRWNSGDGLVFEKRLDGTTAVYLKPEDTDEMTQIGIIRGKETVGLVSFLSGRSATASGLFASPGLSFSFDRRLEDAVGDEASKGGAKQW